MRLRVALEQILAERDLDKVTADQYRRAELRFSEWLGKAADSVDLTVANVNNWIMHLQQKVCGTTARNYRVALTVIWNHLAGQGQIPHYDSRRLRSPKQTPHPVRAWTLNQFAILLASVEKLPGTLRIGIPAKDLMRAWLWVGFDTAFRPSDLRRLEFCQVDLEAGLIIVTQHKTSQPHAARIGPESITALRLIASPDRNLVFPINKSGVRRWELALYRIAAELGFARFRGQGLGTLRKTHATEVFRDAGENAAAESLGHVGGVRTVRKSYIDSSVRRVGRLPRRPNSVTRSEKRA